MMMMIIHWIVLQKFGFWMLTDLQRTSYVENNLINLL